MRRLLKLRRILLCGICGNIKANQVTADVGGNLNVQSLQDKAVSEANQKTTGIALSIPIVGTGGSASFSQSKQNGNSNYASVYWQVYRDLQGRFND